LYQKGSLNREFRRGEIASINAFRSLEVPTAKTPPFAKMYVGWMRVVVREDKNTISLQIVA
jgi:hypothetical protein